MEWYTQPQDTTLEVPKAELFWNTRGRSVEIRDQNMIKGAIQRGFIRCVEGVKPGAYNPIFDRGTVEGIAKPIVTEKVDIQGELRLISV